MHAALRLSIVLCTATIVVRHAFLYACATGALRTEDAEQICGLSASLKLTARTCEGLVEQALRIEKDKLWKIEDTQDALRAVSRRVTEVDTKLATLPDALRRLQADLMAAETAVNNAWNRFYALRAGVRALVRRAVAVVPKATASAGRIDNFITAFATANSHANFSCITEHGVPCTLECECGSGRRKVPNPAATLRGNLTGCTYENYTLARPQNITTTIVDDVVILGDDGMLCMSSYSMSFKDSKGRACPLLLHDFVRKDGTPMNLGGFWLAEQSHSSTVIRFNRSQRHVLLDMARELGKLEWLLSDGSRRDGRWLRADRRVPKTIRQLATDVDSSLRVSHGADPAGDVKDVVDAVVKEMGEVQTLVNALEVWSSFSRRPTKRRQGLRASSLAVTGSEMTHMLPSCLLCFFAAIALWSDVTEFSSSIFLLV
ncbi:hypothetical protein ERJ75_001583500 [Trypanosoma vivax]|nr:hypothetical protein ERJ75_001583500 [Trypanosoma vivax]